MGFVPPTPTTLRYFGGGLFSSNTKWTKCPDPSLDVGGAVGLGPGRGTGLSHRWRNGNASQPCSKGLISQSLVIEVWEGTRDRILDFGQNFQHLHLIGLSIRSRAPQELVERRITIGHLAVVEVPLLHQIFGDELSGLPKDGVLPPSLDPQHTEEFPDLLLGGVVTLPKDDAQKHHEETRLGQLLLII